MCHYSQFIPCWGIEPRDSRVLGKHSANCATTSALSLLPASYLFNQTLLCNLDWPGTCNPVSAFQVLELQACATTLALHKAS